jgi:hypothetical protein
MRNTLILLLFLFAVSAFAQQPVIDSMLIDESKGILSVYGDFGTAQGKVWCDSVELPVLSWSASLITATIPDTGKGSAGGVVVEGIGGGSEARYITLWTSHVEFESGHISGPRVDHTKAGYFLYWRYDIHSILKSLNKDRVLSFALISVSRDSQLSTYYVFDTLKTYDSVSRNPLIEQVYFDLTKMEVDVFIDLLVSKFWGSFVQPGFFLDSNLNVVNFYKGESNSGSSYAMKWGPSSAVSAPPLNAIALQNNPSIIAPKDEQSNLGNDDILLQWDTLKYMDVYHIQLSKDSLINGQHAGQAQQAFRYIVDTIVSSLDFTLPPLEKNTKYYWRVCGMNTEGESRWSDVWSFTTGTSTDVKQERAESTSLTCYPNPAMNELTIVTTEPTRLLLYDVTGKIIKSEQATSNQTKWDVSLLPNGTYILGTSSGDMQVVQIVK